MKLKTILLAGTLGVSPTLALAAPAADPARQLADLQAQLSALQAQNTICSVDLSHSQQDRLTLVQGLARTSEALEKLQKELAAEKEKGKAAPAPAPAQMTPPSTLPKMRH